MSGAGRDAWIAALASLPLALASTLLVLALASRYPGEPLLRYLPRVAGRLAGASLGGMVVAFLLFNTILSVRDFAELFIIHVLPDTPPLALILPMVVLGVAVIYLGIEPLARMGELLLPLVVFLLVAGLVLVAPEMQPSHLLPALADGYRPVLRGVLTHWPFWGEVFLWLILFPAVKDLASARRGLLLGTLVAGIFLTAISAGVIMTFSANEAMRFNYPVFALTRLISVGRFLERVDVLYLSIWFAVNFTRVALLFLALSLSLRDWLHLGDASSLALPLGALVIPLSLTVFEAYPELRQLLRPELWAPFVLPLELGIPGLVLLADIWRRR